MTMHPHDITVLFRGCGDLGTGAAHRLFTAGFPVAIVELARPLAVRRRVAFAEAARTGAVEVEGVRCRKVALDELRRQGWKKEEIPLVVAPFGVVLAALAPRAVVDARLMKRADGPRLAGVFHVVLGPGFEAGRDCDVVVETLRGPALGGVMRQGSAQADTGIPGEVGGASLSRVLRAPAAGTLRLRVALGEHVRAGQTVAQVGGTDVRAAVSGLVRGLLADGDRVEPGQKLGDVDPRPDAPPVDRISDKAHAVGRGVLEALVERFQIALPEAP
jgi:xanthine dehydrogenase accessory factor